MPYLALDGFCEQVFQPKGYHNGSQEPKNATKSHYTTSLTQEMRKKHRIVAAPEREQVQQQAGWRGRLL